MSIAQKGVHRRNLEFTKPATSINASLDSSLSVLVCPRCVFAQSETLKEERASGGSGLARHILPLYLLGHLYPTHQHHQDKPWPITRATGICHHTSRGTIQARPTISQSSHTLSFLDVASEILTATTISLFEPLAVVAGAPAESNPPDHSLHQIFRLWSSRPEPRFRVQPPCHSSRQSRSLLRLANSTTLFAVQ